MKEIFIKPSVIKTSWKVVDGIPVFAMCYGSRVELGLTNPIKYWWWKRNMRKNWNKNNK